MEELPELASTRASSTDLILVIIGARGAHYYKDFVGAALGHFYGRFGQLPLWPHLFVGTAGYRAAPTNLFSKNHKSRLENSKKNYLILGGPIGQPHAHAAASCSQPLCFEPTTLASRVPSNHSTQHSLVSISKVTYCRH
jgi:hypothetical protein